MSNSSLPRIGVMAPSSYVEREDIEKSKALLESKGYSVFIHPQTYEQDRQSAGNILQNHSPFRGSGNGLTLMLSGRQVVVTARSILWDPSILKS